MPKLSELVAVLSVVLDVPAEKLNGFMRYLRPAGVIPSAKRGRGSDGDPDVLPAHAVGLVLAVAASGPDGAKGAAEGFQNMSSMIPWKVDRSDFSRSGMDNTKRLDAPLSELGALPDFLTTYLRDRIRQPGPYSLYAVTLHADPHQGLRAVVELVMPVEDGQWDALTIQFHRPDWVSQVPEHVGVWGGRSAYIHGRTFEALASFFAAPAEGGAA